MKEREWAPWQAFLHYKVALCVRSNYLGSGYVFARRRGEVLRYFTRRGAERCADRLNASRLAGERAE